MQDILIDSADGVMTLTLNRAEKKNSFTQAMYSTCADALLQAADDASVHVVVIQGHATIFSAGNDISDFLSRGPTGPEAPVFRFLRGSPPSPSLSSQRCVDRPWASGRPCFSTVIWFTPGTTPPSPCPL